MRKAQKLWNKLYPMITKRVDYDNNIILSCPEFFYMEDDEFEKWMKDV